MDRQAPILIVDDEANIRTTLRGILQDEGYPTLEAESGDGVLDLIAACRPRLVVLDVWMPHVDGIALLERLQAEHPELPVIVISGHGTIETAVRATKLGAADFIEKPFSLETMLRSVQRALGSERNPVSHDRTRTAPDTAVRPTSGAASECRARTIGKSVVLYGRGLHSGVRTGVILHPLPPGSGIVFGALSSDVTIPATVEHVQSTGYATSLHRDGNSVRTVEHLMSALHGYGVTNLLVKMQGEVPILDGSALEFCDVLESAGIVEQDEEVGTWAVDRPYQVGEGEKLLRIEPAPDLEIHYRLEYPPPVGKQEFHYVHRDAAGYRAEIGPARTFGFLEEMETLEAMGLANGGRLNNCILIGEQGVINPPLRFPDEMVRHKILDLLGDLYLLGRPIRGKVTAQRTGHGDNVALLREIRTTPPAGNASG